MRYYFSNAAYKNSDSRGRTVHIRQFIDHSIGLGHEFWMESGCEHPRIKRLPKNRFSRVATLRRMDVIYVRLQGGPVDSCKYAIFPFRQMVGSPLNVWEFNTAPEFSLVTPHGEEQLRNAIKKFYRYGRGCDLAVCVSQKLSDYVQEQLGICNTIVVPNGSDPNLFKGKAGPPSGNLPGSKRLNVVWIGSADLSWHNFDLMMKAAAILVEAGWSSRIAFHIIGGNYHLKGDLPENVFYHGSVAYDELPGWLEGMDVGLVLYHKGPADFNSPLKLFDYLASELAVIASQQPQVEDVLTQIGAEDFVLPSDDASELVERLITLEQDRERIRILGKAGRQRVIETYNWRRAAVETHARIAQMLE